MRVLELLGALLMIGFTLAGVTLFVVYTKRFFEFEQMNKRREDEYKQWLKAKESERARKTKQV